MGARRRRSPGPLPPGAPGRVGEAAVRGAPRGSVSGQPIAFHGDGHFYVRGLGGCWKRPLVFDVASAAVGACFLHDSVVDSVRLASSTPQRAALKVECLRKMLVAYSRGRRRAVLLESLSPEGGRPRSASVCLGFTKAEAAALPGLMEANATRLCLVSASFHVADPGAPRGAPLLPRMQAVCLALGDEEDVATRIREAADAAVASTGAPSDLCL